MSNRSRARYRFEHDHADDAPAPDPEKVAAVDDMLDSFDKGDQRGGISKWAGMILRDREKALAPPEPAAKEAERKPFVAAEPVREPSPFEAAVLFALGNRVTVFDGARGPVCVPVNVASGGVYGGTVEPARVAHRRRRNKLARAARKGKSRRVFGRVYQSPFGYHVTVPGINDHIVDAEVVEDA